MKNKIVAYYNSLQVLQENIALSESKSPLKPKLVMEDLMKIASKYVEIKSDFKPFIKEDFYIAHMKNYVNEVFNFNQSGKKLASDIPWSNELVTSLTYTSASLYRAIKHSIMHPEDLCFAAISGMHHAIPECGLGFCTFSGQVIASTKIYRQLGKVGCYLDLDGHFGNSIENSRSFVHDLNLSIPKGFNFNPVGYNDDYVRVLKNFLYGSLTDAFLNNKIDYVVWCHGADSHTFDDLGGQVDTEHWVECSKIFWQWVKHMDIILEKPLSVSFALFGGYREDDYQSVINLHISDIITGINTCIDGANIEYKLNYTIPEKFKNL